MGLSNVLADTGFSADLLRMETGNNMAGTDVRLRLRVIFGDDAMLGPGKADLLELIEQNGSIAAAGRAMKMSYKRAWMLVEEMNAAFRNPLVESTRGGQQGGGAQLSDTGRAVLMHYRTLEARATAAGRTEVTAIQALLRDGSDQK